MTSLTPPPGAPSSSWFRRNAVSLAVIVILCAALGAMVVFTVVSDFTDTATSPTTTSTASPATSTTQVLWGGMYPQPELSPGDVTTGFDASSACSATAVATAPIDGLLAASVFDRYKIPESARGDYVIDYVVPPSAGGTTTTSNLWPRSNALTQGTTAITALETRFRDVVCSQDGDLTEAQTELRAALASASRAHATTIDPEVAGVTVTTLEIPSETAAPTSTTTGTPSTTTTTIDRTMQNQQPTVPQSTTSTTEEIWTTTTEPGREVWTTTTEAGGEVWTTTTEPGAPSGSLPTVTITVPPGGEVWALG